MIHAVAEVEPVVSATDVRITSQRKFTTARTPPARTPTPLGTPRSQPASAASASTAADVSSVTRVVSSLGVIELPVGPVHRSKEVDESRRDPESQPEQQEPGRRSQQAVRVVAPDEPDHRTHDQGKPDRREFPERFPGSLIPGRRHVKKDTSTTTSAEQASEVSDFAVMTNKTPNWFGAASPEHSAHACARDAVDDGHGDGGDDEQNHAERGGFVRAAGEIEREDPDRYGLPASKRQERD